MEEIGSILPKVFKKQALGGRMPLVEVLSVLWPRIAGKWIAQQSRPVAFSEGVLTLACYSSSWAAQLRQMSAEISAQINHLMGMPVVRKVRIRHQPEPLAPVGSSEAVDGAPALLTEEAGEFRSLQSEAKLDPEMARIVERSFVKYFSRNGKRVNGCL
ncbi:MAG TPA: DUF721 domain-containing protein [Terriglobia bacterium]|nr:DUF721 domain-containing protein [Terriglobia bacterium]